MTLSISVINLQEARLEYREIQWLYYCTVMVSEVSVHNIKSYIQPYEWYISKKFISIVYKINIQQLSETTCIIPESNYCYVGTVLEFVSGDLEYDMLT